MVLEEDQVEGHFKRSDEAGAQPVFTVVCFEHVMSCDDC